MVLFVVAEHQFPVKGQRSVTLTTILLDTFGKNGGDEVNELRSVILKHLPQPGPNAILLP